MLLLGRQKQHTCQGLSRRAFVQIGASTVLGLSLADGSDRKAMWISFWLVMPPAPMSRWRCVHCMSGWDGK